MGVWRIGRNEACPCGSGKKYKQCCGKDGTGKFDHRSMLRETILEAVETQLRDNNPPETRETLKRLTEMEYSIENAKEMIGAALSCEMFEVMKFKRVFDQARYAAFLNKLPNSPWSK